MAPEELRGTLMKILLLGSSGQVGWELKRSLAPIGQVICTSRKPGADLLADLSDPKQLMNMIRAVQPNVIVNAAAYTDVDKAESDRDTARVVNAVSPSVIARQAAALGAWLIHYSTDYVFDGSGTEPRDEEADVRPLNVYGQTKLEGEVSVRESGCSFLIFRTSWVYGALGDNFAKTMLRLGCERETLSVVSDQVGAPTGAELLADVTAHALRAVRSEPSLKGIYHLAAAGETSWYGYAEFVLEWARRRGLPITVPGDGIQAIKSKEYPAAARRPLNSRLDTGKLCNVFDLVMPNWMLGVERMLIETVAGDSRSA
jgi:dTDP-4-dehydrorhamnose reductase